MTENVTFDGLDCYKDFGMLLADSDPGQPEPQTYLVDVPGRDGALDFTEAFGTVRYKTRVMNLTFVSCKNLTKAEWPAFYSDVLTRLHGQKMQIVFSKDPEYYYTGRIAVGKWTNKNGKWTIAMTVTCDDPFKHLISNPDTVSL